MPELLKVGGATRRGVMAVHLEPAYLGQPCVWNLLRVTEQAAHNTILLPIYATMTEAEQAYVTEPLRRVLRS